MHRSNFSTRWSPEEHWQRGPRETWKVIVFWRCASYKRKVTWWSCHLEAQREPRSSLENRAEIQPPERKLIVSKKHFVGVNVSFRECHQDRSCWCIHFVVPFPRMPVTTRIFSCWLGDPNLNLFFATITRKGDNPRCLCLRNEKIRCFLPTWWCFDS